MDYLYLTEWDAFVRFHQVRGGDTHVIYLPALGCSAVSGFLDVATNPACRATTGVMVDYIGSGASDPSDAFPHSLESHADCVARVIEHLDCGPCPVVGHSLGGSVAIALAASRPDLVSNLIVAEGNLLPGGGQASRSIKSESSTDFAANGLPRRLQRLRKLAIEGDRIAGFFAAS